MELFKNTLFINLEQRTDRLSHVIKQLESLNINGSRLNAVRLKNGAVGCSISHIKCLELAKANNWDQVFICEDDIVFTNPKLLLNNIQLFHKNNDINWDVLIIGGNNCPPYTTITDYCIKVSSCQTTTGYIVKKHYYDTLLTNFKESVVNLLKNPLTKNHLYYDAYLYEIDLGKLKECKKI